MLVVPVTKVSNVATGPAGVKAAKQVCKSVASTLGLEGGQVRSDGTRDGLIGTTKETQHKEGVQYEAVLGGADSVLPSSTGIIGWRIPVEEMTSNEVWIHKAHHHHHLWRSDA
eukprot:3413928-Amphidinium_carterae.2